MKESGLAVRLPADERRVGIERRQFSYSAYLPERRVRLDRRSYVPLWIMDTEADMAEQAVAQG